MNIIKYFLTDYQFKKFWKYVTQLWVTERGRQVSGNY